MRRHPGSRRPSSVCPWDRRFAWMAADLLLRRPRAVRPLPPLDPQAPARARRRTRACRSTSASRPRSTCSAPSRWTAADGPAAARSAAAASCGRPRPTTLESALDAHAVPRPDGRLHDRDRLRPVQLRHRGRRRPVRVRLRLRAGAARWPTASRFFRLMAKQVAKEAGLIATFMPKPYTRALGLRAPLQHEPRRRWTRARTCSADRRRPARQRLEQERIRVRRRDHPPRARASPPSPRRPSTPTSA